ncbi:hypothetical protein A4U53_011150 [Rhizobium ruizarguesonis]|uniref:Uncharacterized protein n=2 Tax=Rhizobium TaxID=379 RepID=A0A179BRD5_RHILE|nr:hypothetical protein [Rhizobium leguminosarum]OAP94256.1 hypothetical protein A4U53_22160 [Rhizobium leguminosarum]
MSDTLKTLISSLTTAPETALEVEESFMAAVTSYGQFASASDYKGELLSALQNHRDEFWQAWPKTGISVAIDEAFGRMHMRMTSEIRMLQGGSS